MFQKEGNEYVCSVHGEELYRTTEIAIAFSWNQQALQDNPSHMPVIHKHGHPIFVGRWLRLAKQRFLDTGMATMANELFMIQSNEWDIKELRNIFSITGNLVGFLRKHPELMPRTLVN